MNFFGETELLRARIGALRWGILVGKQKHNVQKPGPWYHFISKLRINFVARDKLTTGLTLDSGKVL